jgi:uncharacterized membrane protein
LAFQFGNKIGKVRIDELLRRKQKGNNRKWLALSLSLSSFYLGLNLSFFFYFTRFLLCSIFYIVTLHVTKRNLVLSAKFVYFNSTKERKKERKKENPMLQLSQLGYCLLFILVFNRDFD